MENLTPQHSGKSLTLGFTVMIKVAPLIILSSFFCQGSDCIDSIGAAVLLHNCGFNRLCIILDSRGVNLCLKTCVQIHQCPQICNFFTTNLQSVMWFLFDSWQKLPSFSNCSSFSLQSQAIIFDFFCIVDRCFCVMSSRSCCTFTTSSVAILSIFLSFSTQVISRSAVRLLCCLSS